MDNLFKFDNIKNWIFLDIYDFNSIEMFWTNFG